MQIAKCTQTQADGLTPWGGVSECEADADVLVIGESSLHVLMVLPRQAQKGHK